MNAGVRLDAVDKRYAVGGFVLQGLNLDFAPRQLTTLLGPSGCGKSTVLRLVAGLEQPSAGRIWIDGQDMTRCGPDARPISLVFQSYALFPHLNVRANVAYGLSELPSAERKRRVDETLTMLNLNAFSHANTSALSGGQQQRVALARALALRPQVLLLDEPLSNLDVALRRQIREDIRRLQQTLGLTVIYVTHDHLEALAISDRVVVMRQGRVQQVGTSRDVYERPTSEFVADFMGDAAVFDGHVDARGCVRLGPLHWPTQQTRREGPVRLVVRPQAWRLGPASGQGMPGQIEAVAFEGRITIYRVHSELGPIQVNRHQERQGLQVGAPVSVFLDGPGVSVLVVSPAMPEGP
jgi:iron(III) transport system ATP-binding protein